MADFGGFGRESVVTRLGGGRGEGWHDERRSLRVIRGGAWLARPALVRCALRSTEEPGTRTATDGFRCARSLR